LQIWREARQFGECREKHNHRKLARVSPLPAASKYAAAAFTPWAAAAGLFAMRNQRENFCMPSGKIKMFNDEKGFGFIKPNDGGGDVFFHITALREGDKISVGKAVNFEMGADPKSGKSKAVAVDLT
jgi:CspA family cold shock protein